MSLLRNAGTEVLVRRLEVRLALLALAELRGADRVLVLLISIGLVLLRLAGDALAVGRVGVLGAIGLSEGLAVVARLEVVVAHGLLRLAVLGGVRMSGLLLRRLFLGLARHTLAVCLALALRAPRVREVARALCLQQGLALLGSVRLIGGRRLISQRGNRHCQGGC